jgi:hypothetical protein
MEHHTQYHTVKTDTPCALLNGNQVMISQPVPMQRTVESIALQPRPRYELVATPGGEAADSVAQIGAQGKKI